MENLYIDKVENEVWSGYIVATDRGLSFEIGRAHV